MAEALNPILKAIGLTSLQENKLLEAIKYYNIRASQFHAPEINSVKEMLIVALKQFYKQWVVESKVNKAINSLREGNQL